ncbi:MAG: DUF4180 domain-containing protein [Allorhizobium sp.]
MENYQARLVILGDISVHVLRSRAFADFVSETNRTGRHLFALDRDEMEANLSRNSWSI